MHWLPFLILSSIVLTLQTTIAAKLEIAGARPNWPLVLVVFYALDARHPHGILAGWVLGFLADLMTVERMGFLSLSYGMVALAVAMIREHVFRERLLTRFFVTFGASLMLGLCWLAYRRLMYGSTLMDFGDFSGVLNSSLHSAAWAVPAHFVLRPHGRLLGFHGTERFSTAR